MRNAFAQQIVEIAAADHRVVLLSGDIGNRMFDGFKLRFPDRFYNCGIAEQSMIGTAAGMAMCGLRPIAYTIAPFITSRCLEQIRVDLCYHRLPVYIAGVGAGLGYAELGATHLSCEDIAMLRCLPGMTVLCPGDAMETKAAMSAMFQLDGPAYLRLGKKGEPVVHETVPGDFTIGKGIVIQNGGHVCLLSTGNVLPLAVEAGTILNNRGISTRVVSCHTVKPLDTELLAESFQQFTAVVTIEEHSLLGGFGSAVAEWLADAGPQPARLIRIGTPDAFPHEAGDQQHERRHAGLTAEAIVHRTWTALMQTPVERVA